MCLRASWWAVRVNEWGENVSAIVSVLVCVRVNDEQVDGASVWLIGWRPNGARRAPVLELPDADAREHLLRVVLAEVGEVPDPRTHLRRRDSNARGASERGHIFSAHRTASGPA